MMTSSNGNSPASSETVVKARRGRISALGVSRATLLRRPAAIAIGKAVTIGGAVRRLSASEGDETLALLHGDRFADRFKDAFWSKPQAVVKHIGRFESATVVRLGS